MSFGDDLDAGMRELREHAESAMVDTCRITRAGEGRGPWNPTTRDYDAPPRVTVYTGRCEVKVDDVQAQDAIAGEAAIGTQRMSVRLPVLTSLGIRAGDDVEMTSAQNDPDLTGRHFTVSAPDHRTRAAARRLPCIEVV